MFKHSAQRLRSVCSARPSLTTLIRLITTSALLTSMSSVIFMSAVISVSLMSREASASCLLSFEEAQSLTQGDVNVALGGFGGTEGAGLSLQGRLGLTGARELHMRLGACQRSLTDHVIISSSEAAPNKLTLWAQSLELGVKQQLVTHEQSGLVDVSLSLSATVMSAAEDRERGAEQTALGLSPRLSLSYPFELDAERGGFVNLSLGGAALFMDHNLEASTFELSPMMSLSGGADVLSALSLRGELRWQLEGVYGGAAIAYQF